jgi:membrane protease YdiL (CAAX protease family)
MNFDDEKSASPPLNSPLKEETISEISLLPPAQPQKFVPEDLRVPWGWTDLALFIVLAALTFFLLNMAAVRVFADFGITFAQIQHSPAKQGVFIFSTEVPLYVLLLGYFALQAKVRAGGHAWRTLGWRPLPAGLVPRWQIVIGLLVSGLVLSFLVSLISSAFQPKTNLPIQAFFENRLSAILLMSMAVALAPVFEETFFRGYLYPVLARSWGMTPGIFVTGTLFGMMHAMQLWGGWVQIALLIVVGIIFTYARAVSKTVVASYLLHFSYNSAIFLGFLIASHGLRQMPALH